MLQPLDISILKTAQRWLSEGTPVWLCTVIHTFGSSPRAPGSMMVINEREEYEGSLSGGCIERDFIEQLHHPAMKTDSQIITYGKNGRRPDVKLPCDGTIEVLVEYLRPGHEAVNVCEALLQTAQGKQFWRKTVIPGDKASLSSETEPHYNDMVTFDGQHVAISLYPPLNLIVCGLSSVAFYCIDFARALGMQITVCEFRREELRQFHEKYPDYRDNYIELHEQFPAKFLENYPLHAQCAVLALTHDPRIDDQTMMEAGLSSCLYLGVMGSEKNSSNRMMRLRDIGGLDEEQLARIRAPVGLPIGSKSPAEIAIAIMGDIIRVKNGR